MQALRLPCFSAGGQAEAHGAAWQLLASGGGASDLAEGMLDAGAASVRAGDGLARAHALLQLLAVAAEAAEGGGDGGQAALRWGPALDAALQRLAAALREDAAAVAAAAAACASSNSGRGGDVEAEGDSDSDGSAKVRGRASGADLEARRARHLGPGCLRLVKQLLAAGGGGSASGSGGRGGRRGGKTD
jgi:hypothetical protein